MKYSFYIEKCFKSHLILFMKSSLKSNSYPQFEILTAESFNCELGGPVQLKLFPAQQVFNWRLVFSPFKIWWLRLINLVPWLFSAIILEFIYEKNAGLRNSRVNELINSDHIKVKLNFGP